MSFHMNLHQQRIGGQKMICHCICQQTKLIVNSYLKPSSIFFNVCKLYLLFSKIGGTTLSIDQTILAHDRLEPFPKFVFKKMNGLSPMGGLYIFFICTTFKTQFMHKNIPWRGAREKDLESLTHVRKSHIRINLFSCFFVNFIIQVFYVWKICYDVHDCNYYTCICSCLSSQQPTPCCTLERHDNI